MKLCYIRCPFLQWPVRFKVSLDDVAGHFSDFSFIRMVLFFRTLAKQLQVMHDTLHPFVIDMEAAVHQLVTNAPDTISLLIFLEYVTDCFRN